MYLMTISENSGEIESILNQYSEDSNLGSDSEPDSSSDEETIEPEMSDFNSISSRESNIYFFVNENFINTDLTPTEISVNGIAVNGIAVNGIAVNGIPPERIAIPQNRPLSTNLQESLLHLNANELGRTITFNSNNRESRLSRSSSIHVPQTNQNQFVPKPPENIIKTIEDLEKLSKDYVVWNYNNFSLSVPENRYNSEISDRDLRKIDLIRWLTISNSKTIISNLYVKSKIHLTAKANVEFINCEFYPLYLDASVEIYADSRAKFVNCIFHDINSSIKIPETDRERGHTCSVKVRDRSIVKFENCKFLTNDISIITESGNIIVDKCEFESESYLDTSINKFNIYAAKNATVNISNTVFRMFGGKNIFAHDNTKLYLFNVTANESKCGFLLCQEYCEANIENVVVTNLEQSGIQMKKMCKLYMKNTIINYVDGNGIHLDDTSGIITNSCIDTSTYPNLFITGPFSELIFSGCDFANSNMCGIVIKHCARPVFDHCRIINCKEHGFKCMFYTMPEIYSTCFDNVSKAVYLDGKSIMYSSKSWIIRKNSLDENVVMYDEEIEPNFATIDDDSKLMQEIYEEDVKKYLGKIIFNDSFINEKDEVPIGNGLRKYYEGYNQYYKVSMFANVKEIVPCTNICEKELLKNIGISYLMKIDPIKCSEIDLSTLDVENEFKIMFSQKDDDLVECISCGSKLNMKTNKNIFIMDPCGHVVCENCKRNIEIYAQNISEEESLHSVHGIGKVKCMKCMTKILKMNKLFYGDECAICLEKKPRTVIFPCHHSCCYGCASNCYFGNRKCPLCNQRMTGYGILK